MTSYRWVPEEPTSEMIQAMEDRQIEGAAYIAENSIQYALWKEVWKAALSAAPVESGDALDARRLAEEIESTLVQMGYGDLYGLSLSMKQWEQITTALKSDKGERK